MHLTLETTEVGTMIPTIQTGGAPEALRAESPLFKVTQGRALLFARPWHY